MQVTAEVLGPVRLLVDGTPIDLGGSRQRRLLGALLVDIGSVVSTDRLIEAVFAGDPPAGATRTFRTYIARLRRALEVGGIDATGVVVTEPGGYRIDSDTIELDSERFVEGLTSAQDRFEVGDIDGALVQSHELLKLWSGAAFGEFESEEWARVEAARLCELRLVGRELHARSLLESGRCAPAIPELEGIIEDEPFRETSRRLLMLALYRSGRHADALRSGRDYRRFLADETGLQPSHELDELEQLLLDRDPRLDVRPLGRKLRGYLLGPPIAETVLGVIYRASQPSVGRDVAVTAIRADWVDDPSFVRRFETHAQRITSIEHPNVLPLYDYWREPGAAYLVTRYLTGGSLEDVLATRDLSTDEALRLIREIGGALSAAHQRGVTHGRVGPAQVLFDEAGAAYLTGYFTGFDLDADQQSTSIDVAALGALAGTLWGSVDRQRGGDGVQGLVTVRTRRIAERAAGSGGELPYATVTDLVEALESAAGGKVTVEPTGANEQLATIEGPNPYRGLFAFSESDAEVFFGRAPLLDDMTDWLEREQLLVLVGPSGSGKSSAVRAGLLPRIRDDGCFIASMVPGRHPLAELETAISRVATAPMSNFVDVVTAAPGSLDGVLRSLLPDPDRTLVLVIDQLEELFTVSDPAERELFLDVLARALAERETLRVVATVRADFLTQLLEHPILGRLVENNTRLISPLDGEALHAIIIGPAEVSGVAVEPALAAALVADASGAASSLPLLQYTLTELYEHRSEGTMTLEAYHRMGGIGAVLAQRAEEIYAALDANEQAVSRLLFARLINPGQGTEDTRRRARRSELVGVSDDLLNAYGTARLLSFDRDPFSREPTVEVAHEALIQRWPRLRVWVEEDREGMRIVQHLTAAADAWDLGGRDDGELYRGIRLTIVDEWAGEHLDDLSAAERDFVDASRSVREDEQRSEGHRLRRLRGLLVAVAVVAVFAVIAGLVALQQRGAAEESADDADFRRVVAESQSSIAEDRNVALLLAVEAYRLRPGFEALGAVQQAVVGSPHDWLGDIITGRSYRRVGFLSDGSLIATTAAGIEVWDLEDRELIREMMFPAPATDMFVATDGVAITVGREDGTWVVLDDDLGIIAEGSTTGPISAVSYDPESELVAIGGVDGSVELRSISDRGFVRELDVGDMEGTAVTDLAISADGRFVSAAWGFPNPARQWGTDGPSRAIDFMTDSQGGVVLVAYLGGQLVLAALDEVQSFDPDTRLAVSESVSISGGIVNGELQLGVIEGSDELFVVGSGLQHVISPAMGTSVEQLYEAVTTGGGGAVSSDGELVVFARDDGLSIWSRSGVGLFVDAVVPQGEDFTSINQITSDGSTIARSGNVIEGNTSTIWALSPSGPVLESETPPGSSLRVTGDSVVRFAPDSFPPKVLTFDRWDPSIDGFRSLVEADPQTFGVTAPVFSPDGSLFLHPWNNGAGTLDVHEVSSGELLHRLSDIEAAAPGANVFSGDPVYSPDGRFVVYPTEAGFVAIYDTESWNLIDLLDPAEGFNNVVFMRDGERAITHSTRGLEIREADNLRAVLDGPVPGEPEPTFGRMLEITADGVYLKTSGLNGPRLWDAETLQPIGGSFPQDEDASGATLAADVNRLATTIDGDVVVWTVELADWLELACKAAGRNLTVEEWDEFGPRGDYRQTCAAWPAD